MITLLGVGHVFRLGPRIREEIFRRKPGVVCLELDQARLRALQEGEPRTRVPGLYSLLAIFQRRVAQQYEADVGEEMLAAYEAAREAGIPVALIDMDSAVMWRRLVRAIRPLELVRLLFSSATALFVRKERIEAELSRYRDDYRGFMEDFAKAYPTLKRVIVDERNEHMAFRLRELHRAFGNLLALVGDGHIEGLRELLAGEDLEAVRLWDLRARGSLRKYQH